MTKKLRDMVVGDEFYGEHQRVNVPSTFKVLMHTEWGVIIQNNQSGYVSVSSHVGTEYYIVEPEPEWLYECIDDNTTNSNYRTYWMTDKQLASRCALSKIKGGRKMHPDTKEIES